MKTRHEILMEDPEYRRLYAVEGLVTDAAELVARLMEAQGVSKAQLARRLGKSRAWVTQLLSGRANMTLRTFADVVHLLGAEAKLSTQPHMSQHDRPSLLHQWAIALNMPCHNSFWKVRPEVSFASTDLSASISAKQDQVETQGRLEYAA